jgi:hypothetical protein
MYAQNLTSTTRTPDTAKPPLALLSWEEVMPTAAPSPEIASGTFIHPRKRWMVLWRESDGVLLLIALEDAPRTWCAVSPKHLSALRAELERRAHKSDAWPPDSPDFKRLARRLEEEEGVDLDLLDAHKARIRYAQAQDIAGDTDPIHAAAIDAVWSYNEKLHEEQMRQEEEEIGAAYRREEQREREWVGGIRRAMRECLELFLLNHPEFRLAAPVRFEREDDVEPSFELSTWLVRANGQPLHGADFEGWGSAFDELLLQQDDLDGMNSRVDVGDNTGHEDLDPEDDQRYLRVDLSFIAYL